MRHGLRRVKKGGKSLTQCRDAEAWKEVERGERWSGGT